MYEKGKQYRDAAIEREERSKRYDDDGNRLFVPRINSDLSEVQSPKNSLSESNGNNVSAFEFMHTDARDKEERARLRAIKYREEAENNTKVPKMNSTSYMLVVKKAVCVFYTLCVSSTY